MRIVESNLFEKSFRWRADVANIDAEYIVYCAKCDSFNIGEIGENKVRCPICKRLSRKLLHRDHIHIKRVYSKIWVEEEKIRLSLAFIQYAVKYQHEKKTYRKLIIPCSYNITYNTRTKNLFLIKKAKNQKSNRIANITLGKIPRSWKFFNEQLHCIEQDGNFREFVKLLLQHTDGFWKDKENLLEKLRLEDIGFYLKYPQLMLLPEKFVKNFSFKAELGESLSSRKRLSQLPLKQKEVLCWLTEKPSTRRERHLLGKNPDIIFVYKLVVTLVENVDKRYAMLEAFQRYYPLDDLSEQLDRDRRFYGSCLFMNGYFSAGYLTHFLEAKRVFSSDRNIDFLSLLTEAFGLSEKERGGRYSFFDIFHEVSDSLMMYKELKKEFPDYQVKEFERNRIYKGFKRLHDNLMLDYQKLKQKLQVISYSKKERTKYEGTVESYNFTLAESNHHLADVGMQLDNCVASYSSRAIQKKLYIVLMTDKNTGKLTHCLEIKRGKLVQARASHNRCPSDQDGLIIFKYCTQKQIKITTYDISPEVEQLYFSSIQKELSI